MILRPVITAADDKFVTLLFSHKSHALFSEELEYFYHSINRERSGSVVNCLIRDRRAAGSSLTGVTGLWSLSKTNLS